jgi:hypothetical protein
MNKLKLKALSMYLESAKALAAEIGWVHTGAVANEIDDALDKLYRMKEYPKR